MEHFRSPHHQAKLLEFAEENTSAVLDDNESGAYYSSVRSSENGDFFSDSNPTDEAVFPHNKRTIQDVYSDINKSQCGVETTMNSIRNVRLKEFVHNEKEERLRGCRSPVTRAFTSSRGKNHEGSRTTLFDW